MYSMSSRGQPIGGGSPASELGGGLTTSHRKKNKSLRNVLFREN
jgi:hypothetical protein